MTLSRKLPTHLTRPYLRALLYLSMFGGLVLMNFTSSINVVSRASGDTIRHVTKGVIQRPTEPDSWLDIWLSMRSSFDFGCKGPDGKDLGDVGLNNIDRLNDIWSGNENKMDKASIMDLTIEAYLLREAQAMPKARACEIAQEISDDLGTKLNHCKHNPKGMGSEVQLEVKTISGQSESKGWQVFHVLAARRKYLGDPGEPLSTLSSPAKGPVAVGRHLIWAKKGEITTPEQRFTIGLGPNGQKVEIPVP